MNPTPRMRLAALAAGSGGLLLLAGAMGAGAQPGGDPPGNNGTVKIDGVEFDDHPNNEPHVGCVFQVDFYGFDEGDLTADVEFEAIPPTPGSEPLATDTVDIGEDPAGGGTDLDASRTYDLTSALAEIEPHPQQGWHVRLNVNAEGSIGADTKFKVFWVECEVPTTTSSTTSTTSTSSTTSSTTSTTAPGSTTTTTAPGGPTTTAGGAAPPQAPTTAPAAPTQLPRTGVSTMPLTVLGGLLLAGGIGAGLAARRMEAGEGA